MEHTANIPNTKRLLIWGAGDQGTVALDCALATKKYSRIDFLDIRERATARFRDIGSTKRQRKISIRFFHRMMRSSSQAEAIICGKRKLPRYLPQEFLWQP